MVAENSSMEEIPGIVVGGDVKKHTPSTLPAPSTKPVKNVFHTIADRLNRAWWSYVIMSSVRRIWCWSSFFFFFFFFFFFCVVLDVVVVFVFVDFWFLFWILSYYLLQQWLECNIYFQRWLDFNISRKRRTFFHSFHIFCTSPYQPWSPFCSTDNRIDRGGFIFMAHPIMRI